MTSTATLEELNKIMYDSFEGAVWIDSSSSYSGTAYPVGTLEHPVNNLKDAQRIADMRGLSVKAIGQDADDPYHIVIPLNQWGDLSTVEIIERLKWIEPTQKPTCNDGLKTCFDCGGSTRRLDTGLPGDMRICTKCGK